ncbi:MAG: anhydro-N-acetylmuramic acid kinase [Synergistaceae bacterium]|jgi:anhydro-N-acetylmuramic acid kinase|nr:anhydro-N-acetylmuramic acid kinase [Synergistaceae bacterium]
MAYVIGMMSGTSLDGCDAALIRIDDEGGKEEIHPVAFVTQPMPEALRTRVLDCCSLSRSNIRLTCSLNVEMGSWFARVAESLREQAGVKPEEVECIGSHGQTVYHIAEDEGEWQASTLQIGEPAVIAWETGIAVVSGMRAMDMAAGGRGAPLVPWAEYRLYRSDRPRVLQNLGGIGNVTGLPANCAPEDVFAFDTGPGNMIIDGLAKRFYGADFDKDGQIAATGAVREDILSEWTALPYVAAPPPKATGRELYGEQFVKAALAAHPEVAPADWLATATRYTAVTMEINYRRYVFPRCPAREVILSGGGVHNETLRREIARLLPECEILTQEDLGWNSDAKEAVAFALMAHETLRGRPSNMPGATGASSFVVLGNITPAPRKR